MDAETQQQGPIVRLRAMSKRFGEVVACDGVDLDLHAGEIHGILGENGAGKSTLMRMVVGLEVPDRGSITLDGEEVTVRDPLEAARLGIGMVHQHYTLIDALRVWENVALAERGPFDRAVTRRRVAEITERYGLEVDPEALVRDLTAGARQRVEIIKCLRTEPRIIILDEPTAALTPAESAHLFEVLSEGVRREGWAVALVSHKLDEVLAATDRVTVMRGGRVVDRLRTGDADAASLARAMVGRDVTLRAGAAAIGTLDPTPPPTGVREEQGRGRPALEVRDLTVRASDGAVLLDGLSLEVHAGEVVGVAGVEGNGQTPLAGVLASLVEFERGEVIVDGEEVPSGKAGAMRDAGVAVIPADRRRSGSVPEMTVAENLVLSSIGRCSRRGVLRREAIRQRAERLIEEFAIDCPSPDTPLGDLSGGNQQRVLLARALSGEPRALVAHQPTRGLDVGAVEYIGGRLRAAVDDEGIGVLLLSTDLAEIAALADRIVVLYRGRIIGEMSRAEMDLDRLGLLIGGSGDRGDVA